MTAVRKINFNFSIVSLDQGHPSLLGSWLVTNLSSLSSELMSLNFFFYFYFTYVKETSPHQSSLWLITISTLSSGFNHAVKNDEFSFFKVEYNLLCSSIINGFIHL